MSDVPFSRPVVLVATCKRELDEFSCYTVREPYVEAVEWAGGQPLLVTRAPGGDFSTLLEVADGILFTGSPSNVHASHYGEAVRDESLPQDRERDAWTLPLIREAVKRGVPVLGICRGFQEFNVAFGGSLHQAVHEVAGKADHRPAPGSSLDERYALAHPVALTAGGFLESLMGAEQIEVNSVHGQGVNCLADGLAVEAVAPDGLVEAIRNPSGAGFNLAVQWHPEWKAAEMPNSGRIFKAFGEACRAYRKNRG